jgi:hypothetical protein
VRHATAASCFKRRWRRSCDSRKIGTLKSLLYIIVFKVNFVTVACQIAQFLQVSTKIENSLHCLQFFDAGILSYAILTVAITGEIC